MENSKRPIEAIDPDYIFPENKKMKVATSENDNARVINIIKKEFQTETVYKEKELEEIEDRLKIAMKTLQLLRSVVITSYYNQENLVLNTQSHDVNSQVKDPNVNVVIDSQSKLHPAVKKCLGKAPLKFEAPLRPRQREFGASIDLKKELEIIYGKPKKFEGVAIPAEVKIEDNVNNDDSLDDTGLRNERFKQKYRIVIGNISKWIGAENSSQDQSTHKWMAYVRGPKENPNISHIVKKVRFFLHPSYRPNDIIDVGEHPFHLSRRGWGEFPLRVQIHFVNNINKPIDVIHNIKLDHTHSGLQTLGSETFVNVWLYKEPINNLKKLKQVKIDSTTDISTDEMLDTECTMETDHENDLHEKDEEFSISENISATNFFETESPPNEQPMSQCSNTEKKSINEKVIERNGRLYIVKPRAEKLLSPEKKPIVSLLNKNRQGSNIKISLQMHDYCTPTSSTNSEFNQLNSIEQFDNFKFNISKYKLNDISTILLYMLKHLPLASPLAKNESFSCIFPFVAESREEFFSWCKPKQFCSEWYRAKYIKSVLTGFHIPGGENWSVRSILKFARLTKFATYPQDAEPEKSEKILSAPMPFNSYTSLPELETFLSTYCFNKKTDQEEDDEEIDVINLSDNGKKTSNPDNSIIPYQDMIDFTSKDVTSLPNLHIKETVAELGISLVPEKLVDNIWCASAEMCITAATKYLAEDIIRRAILNSNRFTISSEINLEDVKAALLSRDEFDIFFNFGLGKPS